MRNIKNTVKNTIMMLLFIIGFYFVMVMLCNAWDREYEYQQLKEQQDIRAIQENKSK